MSGIPLLPKPEIRGTGHVQYRCAKCGGLMEPEDSVIVDGRSYHPEDAPQEMTDGR